MRITPTMRARSTRTVSSALAALAAVLALSAAAPAAPLIRTVERHYDIAGADIATLRAQMADLGPFSARAERHVPARMEADIGFRFTPRRQSGACVLGNIAVTADITYHYPRWTGVASSTMYLAEKWSNYIASLRTHELGHGQLVIDAAHEVDATLIATGRWKRCDQLRAAARSRGEAILRRLEEAQIEYDALTGGGETQGAVLRAADVAVVN